MEVKVRHRNFEVGDSENIKNNAEKKFRSLEKLGVEKIDVMVEGQGKGVRVIVDAYKGEKTFRATEESVKNAEIYNLLDNAKNSLREQITTNKGVKISGRREQRHSRTQAPKQSTNVEQGEESFLSQNR